MSFDGNGGTQVLSLQPTTAAGGNDIAVTLIGEFTSQWRKRRSVAGFAFSAINSITYRLDSRNKEAAGWLMKVGGKWVACVGKRRSEPMALNDAKRAAVSMLSTKGEPSTVDLNPLATETIDRAELEADRKREFKLWPTNLLGGANALHNAGVEVFDDGLRLVRR